MTSRERILTALNHETPDRVPVDFGGHRSSGIAAIAYARLKAELGIKSGDIYVYDMLQQLAIVEEPVLDRFGVDTIEMGRGFCLDDADWQDWVLPELRNSRPAHSGRGNWPTGGRSYSTTIPPSPAPFSTVCSITRRYPVP